MQSGLVFSSLTVCSTKAITGTYHTSQLLPLMWSNRVGSLTRLWREENETLTLSLELRSILSLSMTLLIKIMLSSLYYRSSLISNLFLKKPFVHVVLPDLFLHSPPPFKKFGWFSSSCHSYKHTKLYLSFLYIHYVMQNINDLQSFLFVLVLLNPPLS